MTNTIRIDEACMPEKKANSAWLILNRILDIGNIRLKLNAWESGFLFLKRSPQLGKIVSTGELLPSF